MNTKSVQPWYKEWFDSPFYHKLYFERNEEKAKDFIQRLVQQLNPPPHCLLLDMGCGKGKQSKMLAAPGFDVTGIDPAPNSIATARQFESETLWFFVHDMRLPFWINYFDYAFSLFTSFGYFNTRREHDNAIRTMADSLKPGGILVMDYPNTHFTEEHLVQNEIKKIGETVYDIQADRELFFQATKLCEALSVYTCKNSNLLVITNFSCYHLQLKISSKKII